MGWFQIFQVIVFLASSAYQIKQHKKQQREIEKRKGYDIPIDGEPINLPVVYGRQKVGGVRVYHKTVKDAYYSRPPNGTKVFDKGLGAPFVQTGYPRVEPFNLANHPQYRDDNDKKPNNLMVQQALCIDGIEEIVDIAVNGLNFNDEDFSKSQIIHAYKDGGYPDPTHVRGGAPVTNRFTNTAYLAGSFRLDRDEPQYNGVPEMTAFVKGMKIHGIEKVNGNYQLTANRRYSNNFAEVLLDYLTSWYGKNLPLSEINLESFYYAAQISDTVADTDVEFTGRVNGVRPVEEGQPEPTPVTRNMKLYECNITIDTSRPFRENIQDILDVAPESDLIWSEGQYKLVLDYPTSKAAEDALITNTYTSDDIVRSPQTVQWNSSMERFNQVTVRFQNENEDFAQDDVVWPPTGSVNHNNYLAEDNQKQLTKEESFIGITIPAQALARAEQIVRDSRSTEAISFVATRKALVQEPGDLIKIVSADSDLAGETWKIVEVSPNPDLTVNITARLFSWKTLAWSKVKVRPRPPRSRARDIVANPVNVQYSSARRKIKSRSNGYIYWDEAPDEDVRVYIVTATLNGKTTTVARTPELYYDIPAEFANGTYSFTVYTKRKGGRLSSGVTLSNIVVSDVATPTNLTFVVRKNNILVDWDQPQERKTAEWRVSVCTTNLISSVQDELFSSRTQKFISLDSFKNKRYIFVEAIDAKGNYSAPAGPLEVTPALIKGDDIDEGTIPKSKLSNDLDYVVSTVPPGKVTGLAATSSLKAETGLSRIVLTWNLPTGSDIIHYKIEAREQGDTDWTGFQSSNRRHWFDTLPGLTIEFRVAAVDRRGNIGTWSDTLSHVAILDTVPPAVPTGLSSGVGLESIWLKWDANTEPDMSHYELYEADSATPAPTAGTAFSYKTTGNSHIRADLPEETTKYFWLRAVDTSGNKSAWTAVHSNTTKGFRDRPLPVKVTGVTLSTQLLQVDGRQVADITATWAAATNAVSYEMSIVRSGAPEVVIPVGGLSHSVNGFKGSSYDVKIRGINEVGGQGPWSDIKTIAAAVDSTPPPVPTGLTATGSFGAIWLKWTDVVANDLDYYDVYESTTTTAPTTGTAGTYKSNAPSFLASGLADSVTRHYWVRAVDTSGNKSAWSSRVQATTTSQAGVTNADLQGLVDATSFASTIKPVEVLGALPGTPHVSGRQVFLTTDKRLYRNTGTGWTAAVDAELVTGQLIAGQIAAGAIGADQIAASAITSSKMLVGDTSNMVPDNLLQDTVTWSLESIPWTFIDQPYDSLNAARAIQLAAPAGTGLASRGYRGQARTHNTFAIPVEPNKPYYVSGKIRGIGDNPKGRFSVNVTWLDRNKAYISSPGTYVEDPALGVTHDIKAQHTAAANAAFVLYRFRAENNTAGEFGGTIYFWDPEIRRAANGELIVDGTVKARHVDTADLIADLATFNTAYIKNANISGELNADKIQSGTSLKTGVLVGSTGTTIGSVESWSKDPAARINSGPLTKITPGKILIQDNTTLDDWRYPNSTTINGGSIETNTISARHIVVNDNGAVFHTGFTEPAEIEDWNVTSGSGELSIQTDTGAVVGGYALRIGNRSGNDEVWMHHKRLIPFDPSVLYKITVRVYKNSTDTGGFYLGLAGFDRTKVLCNAAGSATMSTQHYVVATNYKPSGWVEYTGYIKGHGSSSGDSSVHSNPADPGVMHPNVRYIAPFILANYADQSGLSIIDHFTIEKMTDGTTITPDSITTTHLKINSANADIINVDDLIARGLSVKTTAYIKDANISGFLNANKIQAGTNLDASIRVGSTGVTMGTIEDRADNPAARINATAVTYIDPGKITISGTTRLDSWRHPSNTTTINGGKLYTNSVTASHIDVKTIDIKTATVKTLEVETLNVKVRNITDYSFNFYTGNKNVPTNSTEQVCNCAHIGSGTDPNLHVQFSFTVNNTGARAMTVFVRKAHPTFGSQVLFSTPVYIGSGGGTIVSGSFIIAPGANYNEQATLEIQSNDNNNITVSNRFLSLTELKR